MQANQVKIWSVEGNFQWLDGGAMFGNAPKAMWEKWIKSDEIGRIRLNCRSMLLQIADKYILCETGIGAYMEPKLRERFGVESDEHKLLSSLAKLGLKDSDIDVVILSHLHFDHAGGLLPKWGQWQAPISADQLLFPNARYVVGEKAFERSIHPHPRDKASFIDGLAQALEASGRLEKITENKPYLEDFKANLSFIFSDGHTPGQMLTRIEGESETVIFTGDVVPGSHWVHVPITMGYDRFAEKVIDEKKNLYESMSLENSWIFYTHDAEFVSSKLCYLEEKKRYVPKDLQSEWVGKII